MIRYGFNNCLKPRITGIILLCSPIIVRILPLRVAIYPILLSGLIQFAVISNAVRLTNNGNAPEEESNWSITELIGMPIQSAIVLILFFVILPKLNEQCKNILAVLLTSGLSWMPLRDFIRKELCQFFLKEKEDWNKPNIFRYRRWLDYLSILFFLLVIGSWSYTKSIDCHNYIALALTISSLCSLPYLPTRTCTSLQIIMLIYDGIMVYGSPIMKDVAVNMPLPLSLLLPSKDSIGGSLLGLGDIALPSLFLLSCQKYDYHKKNKYRTLKYAFIGYLSGLVLALVVSKILLKAQPALVFIVPVMLSTTMVSLMFSNELREFFVQNESPLESIDYDYYKETRNIFEDYAVTVEQNN